MRRVLLLLPTSTYRSHDLMEAAKRLDCAVVVASEEASTMETLARDSLLTLNFREPNQAAERAAEFHASHPVSAVISVDEETEVVAAAISERLSLPHNTPLAARRARLKHEMREVLARGGVQSPRHRVLSTDADPRAAARTVDYPTVLKPVFLSGSRGVIRADDEGAFVAAFERVKALLSTPELIERGGDLTGLVLAEDYVPGLEVALEGILTEGCLHPLAIFDKPDPLDGPYFEETLYVTPSRLPAPTQKEIVRTATMGSEALGLRHGPVHAELRVGTGGVVSVIEVAGRSIGGLCSRTLRFGTGFSLEDLMLRHALGEDVTELEREANASGVMMIPIPKAGVLRAVDGVDEASSLNGVNEVTITAPIDSVLVPLPEGSSYLGFIFASGNVPEAVEAKLREAHARLRFQIE